MSATKLSSALSDNSMRGNWGEVQLRRVIEHSNMLRHVDYVEQKQSKLRMVRSSALTQS
uniref:Uncharacterized protein n=1 Tax=uncultured marine group II/III euryarchaeote AD1000_39_G05 TaxID=1457764 RepID=A0A075FVS3_9EURY|nr:hypothetical protein [uncultured marine group II/III euryarchaeote AD1000_39_G05]